MQLFSAAAGAGPGGPGFPGSGGARGFEARAGNRGADRPGHRTVSRAVSRADHWHARAGAHERIARAVAASLPAGSSVLLDAGAVCTALAHQLRGHAPLTVAVTSLDAALALAGAPGITVLVLGGQLRALEPDHPTTDGGGLALSGPLADQALAGLDFDVFVMAPTALSPTSGWAAGSLEQASLQRAALARAAHTVVAADAAVLTARSLVRTAALDEVPTVVTDHAVHDPAAGPLTGEVLRMLTAAGVEVVVV